MTVEELAGRMPLRELLEWDAMYRIWDEEQPRG